MQTYLQSLRSSHSFTAAAVVALAVAVGAIAFAQPAAEPPAGNAEMQLPPGWTLEDMQTMIAAGTPGEMHQRLAGDAGVWKGKNKMWMTPGSEPIESESTSTVEPIMDGRYVRCEFAGEMPGMGAYRGFGLQGFDNVSKQFVSVWIDNHSTGIMNGVGELSEDGKTLSWRFTHNCPLTGKPTVMREIETRTGPHSKRLEMFGIDPKSGQEFKMMEIELTKAGEVPRTTATTATPALEDKQ